MSFLFPIALGATATPPSPTSPGFEWVFLAGFLVIFYLMIWRPQAKRSKEQKKLLSGLSKNDEVITTGGICGKISTVHDDFIILEVSTGVFLRIQKIAVVSILPKGTFKDF